MTRKPGQVAVGHPVDVASGIFFTARHDIEIPGEISLIWRAFYSTASLDRQPGPMGPGWSSQFDQTLRSDLDGYTWDDIESHEVFIDDAGSTLSADGRILVAGSAVELRRRGALYDVLHWHSDGESILRYVFRPSRNSSLMLLEAVEDLAGNQLRVRRDEAGRPVSVTQSLEGRSISLIYSHEGLLRELRLSSRFSAPEPIAWYEYDAFGRLTHVVYPNGRTVTYAYDELNRIVMETSHGSGTYHIRYDSDGRCVETTGEGGYGRTLLTYNPNARTTEVTDSMGAVTRYEYNEHGQITRLTTPGGGVSTNEYDEFGRMVAMTDAAGGREEFHYNDTGDLAAIAAPSGELTEWKYNEFHNPISAREPNDATTRYEYDDGQNLIAETDALGALTGYYYSTDGGIVGLTDPSGEHASISRDAAWSQEQIVRGRATETRRFNARGQITELADGRHSVTRYEYDLGGALQRIVHPDGASLTYVSDHGGLLIAVVDESGRRTSVEYSQYGHPTRVVNARGEASEYTWDTEGRLIAIRNAKAEICRFAYDANGNLVGKQTFDGRVERYEYDRADRLIRTVMADGITCESAYDTSSRLVREHYSDGSSVEYAYDEVDNLVRIVDAASEITLDYDLAGNVIAENQNGVRFEYGFEQSGLQNRRSWTGSRVGAIRFGFDSLGRWVIYSGDRVLQTWAFDESGNLSERITNGGVERLAYDERGRMVEQRFNSKTTPADSLVSPRIHRRYSYDASGKLLDVADAWRGSTHYHYDAAGRITSVTTRKGVESFAFDPAGNLVTRDGKTLSYAQGDRLIRHGDCTYEYDAAGRVSAITRDRDRTTFEWDVRSRLTRVVPPNGEAIRFDYDATGRRIRKQSGDKVVRYFWAQDQLAAEESDGVLFEYLDVDEHPTLVWRDGVPYDAVSGYMPAAYELISPNGAVAWRCTLDPWGGLLDEQEHGLRLLLRLPGQYEDPETGLHYNYCRYYDPSTANFLAPDPAGIAAGLNGYAYVADPINFYDPFGLDCRRVGCPQARRRVRRRVNDRRRAMTQGQEHRRTTYAIAEVRTRSGSNEVWAVSAGGRGYVRPGIRGRTTSVPSPWPAPNNDTRVNDAERHLLRRASQEGATILAIGATRPMCPVCEGAVRRAGYGPAIATPTESGSVQ